MLKYLARLIYECIQNNFHLPIPSELSASSLSIIELLNGAINSILYYDKLQVDNYQLIQTTLG